MRDATAAVVRAAVRHRRRSRGKMERTSLSIRADILGAARELVRAGEAENLSALVEGALEEMVRRSRQAAIDEAYEAASRDPEFMAEIRSVNEAFEAADQDGL